MNCLRGTTTSEKQTNARLDAFGISSCLERSTSLWTLEIDDYNVNFQHLDAEDDADNETLADEATRICRFLENLGRNATVSCFEYSHGFPDLCDS